jgi:hypothetical protein
VDGDDFDAFSPEASEDSESVGAAAENDRRRALKSRGLAGIHDGLPEAA